MPSSAIMTPRKPVVAALHQVLNQNPLVAVIASVGYGKTLAAKHPDAKDVAGAATIMSEVLARIG